MRTVVLGAALLLSLTFARTAAAVCTAADVMQCGASCWKCSGNTCTLGKLLTVTPPTGGASCLFDFGSRDIVLASGGFTSGANAFEIRAHSLTVGGSGTLKATGNLVTPGGIITVTLTGGGFTLLKSANPIDVTGAEGSGPVLAGGGSVIIQSDGDVALGGMILADGTTTNASGGTIMVTAGRLSGTTVVASGNLTVTNVLSSGSGANGIGGTIAFTANGTTGAGKIDIENKIIALGGLSGGAISLDATGDVVLGVNPNGGSLLIADANGNAGCGGTIDVLAGGNVGGKNGITSPLVARGSAAALASDGGGGGGMISIETQRGTVDLEGGSLGGIAADGGINGCGGGVCINTDTPGAGITTAVPISANASGPTSFGGCVQLCSSGAALVHDDIDASGGCGGGSAEVDTLQTLTVEPPTHSIHSDATTGSGGCVVLSAGGPTAVSVLLNAATTATAAGNTGGEVDILSNGSGVVSAPVNASGSGANVGGVIDIEAGSDLTIGSTATLNADGGASGSDGGTLTLVAGSPDLPGTLTLGGQAHARGTSSGLGSAQARLTACTVAIGATGSLDTTGDTQAANFIVARKMLNITAGASIKTTGSDPTSRNFVTVPSGSPTPGGPAFSPPLAPSDVTFAPRCTAFNTPPNCLTPCPVCGNGVVEYPETCDDGASNGPCKSCGPTCRSGDCNDNDPCTTDACDPIAGCTNVFIPGCTTTTTTTTLPTSSTTGSTATTTTLAPTTSTATATITSTTTVSTSSTTTNTSPTTSTATSTITTSTVTSTTTASTSSTTTNTSPTTSTVTSTNTTSTVTSTTTASTSPEASTTTTQASTTTTLPCTSARCVLDAARADAACADQNVPSSVVARLGKAETLLDEAGTSPAKKARRLHATAKRVLRAAERVTTRLAKTKNLSVECAAVLKSAVDRVVAAL